MAKILFNVKFRPQIESGEYTVENRNGVHVTILEWDIFIHGMAHMMLIRYDDKYDFVHSNGRINRIGQDSNLDLFIVTPEEEMTEFEIRLLDWLSDDTSGEIPIERMKEVVRNRAAELRSLVKEEFENEAPSIIETQSFREGFKVGEAKALKNLPRWKKATGKERFNERLIVLVGDNDILCTNYAEGGEYYILFSDLEKLLKED